MCGCRKKGNTNNPQAQAIANTVTRKVSSDSMKMVAQKVAQKTLQKVRYIGQSGEFVIGLKTGEHYGELNQGDLVFIHESDIASQSHLFIKVAG